MIPFLLLDKADIPGGGGELRLMQRGDEFSIMLGQNELMNSRLSGSEEELATLACDAMGDRPKARLLIGGLGMGFTLRAALSNLGPQASVVVAELVPAVVEWAKGPMSEIFGDSLSDRRVTVQVTDVMRSIRTARSHYDAILLDVDNGPEGLTRSSNDALYTLDGLHAARNALTPGGVLAVWSSSPSAAFTRRLGRTGMRVQEVRVRAGRRSGARHMIWLATKPR
jgi:spermidine synthase